MKTITGLSLKQRSLKQLLLVIISVSLSLLLLHSKLLRTPTWTNGTLAKNHESCLNGDFTNNEQSRVLQFLIPEGIRKITGCSIETAYSIQRLFFFALTFIVFFSFCKLYLNKTLSILCLFLLFTFILGTFKNHLQESSPLLALTFILSLYILARKSFTYLPIVMSIGLLNNETMLIFLGLIPILAHEKISTYELKRTTLILIKNMIIGVILLLIIRWTFIENDHLGGYDHLARNLFFLHVPILAFHALWFFSYLNLRLKPQYLRRCMWIPPLLILPHLFLGAIDESRQLIPAAFVIIPSAMWSLNHIFIYKTTLFKS